MPTSELIGDSVPCLGTRSNQMAEAADRPVEFRDRVVQLARNRPVACLHEREVHVKTGREQLMDDGLAKFMDSDITRAGHPSCPTPTRSRCDD